VVRTSWPNRIPLGTRIWYLVASPVLLAYGSLGIFLDDIYLPARRTRSGIHLHGVPAWIMYAAMLCATANMISVVIDHYDTRPNERYYRRFAKWTGIAGWSLFGLSLALALFFFKNITR